LQQCCSMLPACHACSSGKRQGIGLRLHLLQVKSSFLYHCSHCNGCWLLFLDVASAALSQLATVPSLERFRAYSQMWILPTCSLSQHVSRLTVTLSRQEKK
jgi:hypothetical protein